MPVRIDTPQSGAPEDFGALVRPDHGMPRLRLRLTPHRSLTPEGFVWFVGLTASLLSLPLLSVIGTSLFWGLLPFVLAAITAIWWGLKRSWRDMELREDIIFWDDLVRLERVDPGHGLRDWEANPFWVRVTLHHKGGPVPNYVTLTGGTREVEVGTFLTPGERAALKATLDKELGAA